MKNNDNLLCSTNAPGFMVSFLNKLDNYGTSARALWRIQLHLAIDFYSLLWFLERIPFY